MSRINHNIPAMITGAALRSVNRDMAKSLERLSTGLRINRASDDAAGLSVSEQLRTQVRGIGKAKQNAGDGISLLQIAEGACNEISAILQRMREIAIQSRNDTITTIERGYLDQEYQHLMQEIDRMCDVTQFNGMTLLDGRGSAFGTFGSVGGPSIMHVGPNATASDELAITINGISVTGLGLSTGGISTSASALTAIISVDVAIDSVNRLRSDLGAYINRMEHTVNNLENAMHNMQAAESVIRDVDFAEATSNFTRNQIILQSATAMLAQANTVPQSVLSLLG